MYVEKSSNLVYYFEIPGQVEVNLIWTSVDFLNPTVPDYSDIQYTVGHSGYLINWVPTDMNPYNYTTYLGSGIITDSELWVSGDVIVVDVSGLPVGTYTYRIVVQDLAGNTAEDTVIITVNPIVSEFN